MTNTSIKNAFQRMWEYTLTKLPNLPSISTADTGKLLTVDQNGEWAMAENAVVDISLEATILASNWSTSTTNGYYTNQVNVMGIKAAYNPQVDLIITSAELAEDERSAMGQIIEAETFDGYVIFRALEAPTINLNVKFFGMFANATDDLATKDYVDEAIPTISYVESIMLTSGWSGQDYSFESNYPNATYDIEIFVAKTATTEQLEAFGTAKILGSATDNVVTALGDVPTVDIPIIIKVVKK